MNFTRYAIYYVPPAEAAWARFATSWLGWDMQAGQAVDHPSLPDLPVPLAEITRAARKYGLHATLKPPFRLAAGAKPADLEIACADLARSLAPLSLAPLRLTRLGRFLALCPATSVELSAGLSGLAASCVRGPDHLRAPQTPAERDRHRTGSLTTRQEANLTTWGYPYVLDDFRFHITLTGRLSGSELSAVQSVLEQSLMPLLPQDVMLADLALTGEDAQGRFHLLRRFVLSG